jgi:hypothetical protein
VYAQQLPPEVYEAEVKFSIGKVGAVYVYPCRWWFGYGSGSLAGLRGWALTYHPPMDHLCADWFE